VVTSLTSNGIVLVTLVLGIATVLILALMAVSGRKLDASLKLGFRGATADVNLSGGYGGNGASLAASVTPPNHGPLSWLPNWKQFGTLLPDGSPDPAQYNDCGETCVSMVVAAVHGTPIEAGSVRQAIGGSSRSGLTIGADLVAAFSYYNVAAASQDLPGPIALSVIRALRLQANPTIVLGRWLNPSSLHWILVWDTAAGIVGYCDPWSGQRQTMASSTFLAKYAGTVVQVNAHCHYDMSSHPAPGMS
jgi:hypothetical protein